MAERPHHLKNTLLGALAITFVAAGLGAYHWQARGSQPPPLGPYYYSTDDGHAYFASNELHIPPFQQQGKEAVAAVLFADSSNKSFIGYLYKYAPEGQELLSRMKVDNPSLRKSAAPFCLVKRPAEDKWVPMESSAGRHVIDVRDPATHEPAKIAN